MDVLYVERLDLDSYTFRPVKGFVETNMLQQALDPFFVHTKGLHVALICQDKPLSEEALFSFFEYDYTKIVKKDTKNSNYIVGDWRNGHYVYCGKENDLLKAIETIIKCMGLLGRDVTKANCCLKGMRTISQIIATISGPINEVWRSFYASKLSDCLISTSECAAACADIRILIRLPAKCFEIFKSDGCYFPRFFDSVVKGVSETRQYARHTKYVLVEELFKDFCKENKIKMDHFTTKPIIEYVVNAFSKGINDKNTLGIYESKVLKDFNNYLTILINKRLSSNSNEVMLRPSEKDILVKISEDPER